MAAPLTAPPSDPTAVFGRRIVAFLIDFAVFIVPGLILFTTQFKTYDTSGDALRGTDFCDAYIDQVNGACFAFNDTVWYDEGGFNIVSLAPLGLSLLGLVILQGLTGWTVGKLLTGLRTVKEDGSVIGLGRALVRWILLVVDGLPCLGLVGLITAGTSTGHRRVGDMAAKSYVVRAGAAGSPIMVPGTASYSGPPAAYGPPGAWTPPGSTWGTPQGAEPAQSGWAAPGAATPPAGPSAATPAADPSAPQWDAARGTYIQWDPNASQWLQWDEGNRTWTPIPGQ